MWLSWRFNDLRSKLCQPVRGDNIFLFNKELVLSGSWDVTNIRLLSYLEDLTMNISGLDIIYDYAGCIQPYKSRCISFYYVLLCASLTFTHLIQLRVMVYDLSRSSAWAARFHRPRPIAHPAYTKEFNYREACQPRADMRVKVTLAENQHKYKKKWLRSRFSMLFGVIDCISSSLLKQLSPLLDLFKKSHLNSTEVM